MKPHTERATKQFYDLTYSCAVATINQVDSNNCEHHEATSDVTEQRSQKHTVFTEVDQFELGAALHHLLQHLHHDHFQVSVLWLMMC